MPMAKVMSEPNSPPANLLTALNSYGGKHGIGRIDIVENRYVGVKSRGVYETPGGTILHLAHTDIEGIAMDREVMRLRDMLSAKFAELIYNGFWFSPEMEFLRSAIDKSQEVIDGTVNMKLYKGNVIMRGRRSESDSLFDEKIATFEDDAGAYDQKDAEGFINLFGLQLKIFNQVNKKRGKK